MFTRIGSILKTTPRRQKSADSLFALQIRQITKEVLDKILEDYPEEFSKSVKVKSFKNGVLSVVSPRLLSVELHTRSGGLIKDINKALGKNIIERIRFRSY